MVHSLLTITSVVTIIEGLLQDIVTFHVFIRWDRRRDINYGNRNGSVDYGEFLIFLVETFIKNSNIFTV